MSEIYRDPSEGSAAKRTDLLRRRRDELATMPHAIRRVVVARSARAAAGIALTIGGVLFLTIAHSARLAGALASVMPGIQPAAISTVLSGAWLLGLAAFLWSRARSEHRFAVAMSHYVLPGGDLDYDLQRLDHEHPDQMARYMAHRREVASSTWFVLGTAIVVPPTAVYVLQGIAVRGWPQMAGFEHALSQHANAFIYYAAAGVLGALVMTMRASREPRAAVAFFALALAIAVAAFAVGMPGVGAVAIVPAMMGLVVRRLRRERSAIAAEDPAAGSELFSFRETLRTLWCGVRTIARFASTPQGLRGIIALVVIGTGWQYMHRSKTTSHAAVAPTAAQAAPVAPNLLVSHDGPHYTIHQQGQGYDVDVDLDGSAVEIEGIGGLASIPDHWRAQINVTTHGGPVLLTPFLEDTAVTVDGNYQFEKAACTGPEVPLGLRVVPTGTTVSHVTIHVTPVLTPTECPATK